MPMPMPMPMLLFLGLALLLAAAAATTTVQGLTLRPDCPASCGGVNIPYPFGIGPNCSREGFEIACDNNNNNNSNNNSVPVLAGTSLRVTHLSINPAQSKVMLPVGWQCYNASDPTRAYGKYGHGETLLNRSGVYQISHTHNMLVVLGCNTAGYTVTKRTGSGGRTDDYAYLAGCMSYCNNSASAQDGLCTGIGCCHVDIPPGLTTDNYFNFTEYNHAAMMDYSPCDYAFLVDRTQYTFARSDLKMDVNRTLPVWLDWAIRNMSCADADAVNNTNTEYACKSNHSSCADSNINGSGYTCKCSKGYEGNPYVVNGCTNINECDWREKYPCKGVCKDTAGSYECSCRTGYHSDDPKTQKCTPKFPLAAQISTGIVLGASVLSIAARATQMHIQKKKRGGLFIKNGGLILKTVENLKIFDKEEIKKVTKGHSDFLGKGSFGNAYEGTLDDNTTVAVKDSIEVKEDMMEEFAKEVQIQSKMVHKNVVKLFGCCLEVNIPKLVYEFPSRRTLRDILHDNKDENLSLDARLEIAIGSAEGLSYMQLFANQAMRHGDVNPDNILLDDKLVPKIFSDFWLSRLLKVDEHSTKVVVGCIGYMDPVFVKTGLLTQKSDVYSFGVILLELITRKKNIYGDNRSLVMEFRKVFKKENSRRAMFDTDIITTEEDIVVLEEISKLAMECLSKDIEDRPDMREVAERLTMLRRNRNDDVTRAQDEQDEQDERSPTPESNESPSSSNDDMDSKIINTTLSMLSAPTKKKFYAYPRKLISFIVSKLFNACAG